MVLPSSDNEEDARLLRLPAETERAATWFVRGQQLLALPRKVARYCELNGGAGRGFKAGGRHRVHR
ncbi:hypothetical protein BQ8482_150092 [Mesorhizobium delmotii]|uniref:Uncharacterized protein n=1 Tax=Mesorhizobium delmotii TaxID=1631247 RepID=A0A2P9AH91_9HYPH|nr:hypothetical protein BQ8482_150092 [Mesorhizobium delmotii]